MNKCTKVCLIFIVGILCLTSCGKESYEEQRMIILEELSKKYEENFYIIDIERRATNDLNSQGDVYYAYAAYAGDDERKQNKGFYCEINSTLSNLKDAYLNVCLQPALEGHYTNLVPENAVAIGLLSTQGDEIISKYTYKNIVSNKIPYTISVIVPVTEDNLVTINGDTESVKFDKFFKEIMNSSNVNANVIYCDESYVSEYKDFINHLKPFDYKVKYDMIYADASFSTENGGNFQEQFIRQINNDLAAIETEN